MKRIAWVFWGFLALLTGLWLMADTLLPAQRGYFDFRTVWVQYTGVIAMGVMSLAMLLAVRPVWLESHLDGLDKTYRLHITSMDYNHGFSLQPANINIQIVPGYEHVVTVTPNQSGTYSVVCNEYCGINHHTMVGRIYVK